MKRSEGKVVLYLITKGIEKRGKVQKEYRKGMKLIKGNIRRGMRRE
jgi:hypothetical protein